MRARGTHNAQMLCRLVQDGVAGIRVFQPLRHTSQGLHRRGACGRAAAFAAPLLPQFALPLCQLGQMRRNEVRPGHAQGRQCCSSASAPKLISNVARAISARWRAGNASMQSTVLLSAADWRKLDAEFILKLTQAGQSTGAKGCRNSNLQENPGSALCLRKACRSER